MNLGPVNYALGAPEGYRCTTCGAHGCKLWREYQTCADYSELVCCAGKSQGKDVSDIDVDEVVASFRGMSTCRICGCFNVREHGVFFDWPEGGAQ